MRLFNFIQYRYYHDFFCLGPSSRLLNSHRYVWFTFIDTTKNTVVCMSSLLSSIDLQIFCYFILLLYIYLRHFCYFIMFYFILTNGAMVKLWIVKWCNGETKNRNGHLFSHKYWIFSFLLFPKTIFLQQTKKYIIFNFWSRTTSTETKFLS